MTDVLNMANVTAGYQSTVVLEDVSLAVAPNSIKALLGRNGAGKTTLLSTIMGLTRVDTGSIRFKGEDLARVPTHRRAGLGIALVPQEREIFPSLTVHENMCVSMRHGGDWTIERVYDLFPRLRQRWKNYGDQLSGGEQQMLAIGRALVSNPSLLLLDEPFEGLAPVIVDMLVDALSRIRTESAIAMILVEHNVDLALDLAEEAVVLDRGQIAWAGTCDHLLNDRERLAALIGLQDIGDVSRANAMNPLS
jgi:branched-chain amino acid transport system ATP-binding protein